MGLAKKYWMEMSESPWLHSSDLDDKYVCCYCIKDDYLCEVINQFLEAYECSYCNRRSKILIAAPLREIIGIIYQGICMEWYKPGDVLSYDGREGGWLGSTICDGSEMDWFISEEAGIEDEQLLCDIASEFSGLEFCEDPGHVDYSESLKLSWHYFSDLVRRNYRYTFFLLNENHYLASDPLKDELRIKPKEFLSALADIVKHNHRMITVFEPGTKLYRSRLFKDKKSIKLCPDELGAPPEERAIASRMSPAGIPLFYCSRDKDTAINEVLVRKNGYKYLVISEFELLRRVEVINFHDIPSFISLFDLDRVSERRALKFLQEFSKEISAPVNFDGSEHIEYVPTQIITEYFRYLFYYEQNRTVSGLMFPSAQVTEGVNIGLFINQSQCQGSSKADDSNLVVKLIDADVLPL